MQALKQALGWHVTPAMRYLSARLYATVHAITDVERNIANKLKDNIQGVKEVMVKDTSGGCGAMYQIDIAAEAFKGKSIVKQHQEVHKVLQEEMKTWHGVTLTTKAN
mmetsp:Transcript_37219/g.82792  ORF Transcript_37219/g.82792 Transcript_37219/m.82792 type:complete len:107 (+) Transcript_37219:35-355(+)|eukprot:CAMPEP_0202893138 /NCGR_PEP_ID=MMETSP1392-20130828/2768_1 /ASSEMBLY_ACC=CAM_ASM_000868 /TAXON_ID=225041 /ORGANISM="Chlamydomonas chlamydogama, Strain SAG 11-48b" /LENGTH=106 /DNA_ID=CAMNT_0049577351 /DNA_START=23 /DNA_END=343 /DNA_ORIENTATION=-